jgi:dihydroflavonol-4-reductase
MEFETATVTGATGHLGNVLVRELVRHGKRVRALALPDDTARSLSGLPVEIVRGDVTRPETLPHAIRGAEVVFHLAGVVSISTLDDERVLAVNAAGTRNVVAACRAAGVRRLVHTGSVHALVEPGPGGVLDEAAGFDPSRAVGAYGKAKAEGALAVAEGVRDGLDAVMALPVAVVGPFDYRLSAMGEMIALFARRSLPAIVDGGYDFVDVRDVALGHLLACERGRRGESYLLTGGHLRIRELVRILANAAGRRPPRLAIPLPAAAAIARLAPAFERLTGRRALLTPYSVHTLSMPFRIDGRKARAELGFDPMPLDRSLADAWQWMTSDPDSPLRRGHRSRPQEDP